ncbi:hypothetical protein OKW21_003838 [Catalinimonas alkaloidigena]|nr:hypothetical protein [Catalinimonas alkaloidigena]
MSMHDNPREDITVIANFLGELESKADRSSYQKIEILCYTRENRNFKMPCYAGILRVKAPACGLLESIVEPTIL